MRSKDIFQHMGMIQSRKNLELLYRLVKQGELDGAIETSINNFLHGGSEKFDEEMTSRLTEI